MARPIGLAASVLLGTGATAGCGASAANASPPATAASTAAEEDEAIAGLFEHHRYHHHGGVMLFIAMSLDTLGVSPEQRVAVEKIRTDLHARMEPARAAEQNLEVTLADGVASGNVDTVRADTAVTQVTAAAAAVHDASVDALNALHDVLTSAQRSALVDKVQSHWAVWSRANSEDKGSANPDGGRLETLASDLALAPDQVNTIRARLGETTKALPPFDSQEIEAYLKAFGDAFRSATFDAKALSAASGANSHLVGRGAANLEHFVETVSPVLTPDQRGSFAQRLREHAAHDPSAEGRL